MTATAVHSNSPPGKASRTCLNQLSQCPPQELSSAQSCLSARGKLQTEPDAMPMLCHAQAPSCGLPTVKSISSSRQQQQQPQLGLAGSPLLHPGRLARPERAMLQKWVRSLPKQPRDRAPRAGHQDCSRLLRTTCGHQNLQGQPAVAEMERSTWEAAAYERSRRLMLKSRRTPRREMLHALATAAPIRSL